MKHLYFFIIGTLIFSCTSNFKSIQGHWHSTDSINNGYYTLDVEDSTVIFNKYDRYSNRAEYTLVHNDGKLIIPIGREFFPLMDTCTVDIHGDTLYLKQKKLEFEDAQTIMKWIRPEYNSQDAVNDFQSQIEYKVDLPIDNESIPYDSVIENKLWCMVNIGYPKSEFHHEIRDSLVINMNDAIGEFSDFPLLLDVELDVHNDLYPSDSLDEVLLIINAHKDTPEYYFDSIKYYLKDYIHLKEIYRTYNNQNEGLVGLEKLQ